MLKKSRYVIKSESYDGESDIYFNIRNSIGFKVPKKSAKGFGELSKLGNMSDIFSKYHFYESENDADDVLSAYKKARNNNNPLHLTILAHENCNFRCIYCYERFEKNKLKPEVEEGIEKFVNKRIEDYSYKEFSVSWFGGEPLLAPDVIERLSQKFIKKSNEYGINYAATVTTNGYFLNDSVIDLLLRNQVKGFQITIDGTKETHDKQRILKGGQGTYDVIINNLKKLSERTEDFHVILRMNVGEDNYIHVVDYIEEMKRLFGRDDRFRLYFHNIGKWGGSNDENLDVCAESTAIQLTNLALDKGATVERIGKKIKPHSICYAASPHSFVFGTDGMLYKCTVALYDDINHVGQLNQDGSLDLDRNKFDAWTESGIEDSKCKECFLAPSCHGDSCPWIRLTENRTPCPDHKTQMKSIITTMDRQGEKFIEVIK
ncbi:radical SAM/SPASM domain-containing protein [Bacillus suaedaesalsae]|uniref:Radical SAM protein n=1 Tax=Bacillus suaedaesalsae TaxID=2810349 RepID=A0ABS2DKV7_9BACI|nr:radical SAM protein [Bacillus suaedaesalsae]MBM6619129.1 radical SAM protein [Bacillus suaedaesalsae]